MLPRLTFKHIALPPFSTLRVRYAAQVLSHSVAAALRTLFHPRLSVLPTDVQTTATFVDRFDALFNAMNSRTLHSSQPMGHAFSTTSGHEDFFKETLDWLDGVRPKGKRQLPCLTGWKMAIRSVQMLWADLRDHHGFRFLLTSRLNQDCLENFFSRVRCNNSHVDSPSAGQLRLTIRRLMVDQIFDHSKNSNCEDDGGMFLLNVKSMRKLQEQQAHDEQRRQEEQQEDIEALGLGDADVILQHPEQPEEHIVDDVVHALDADVQEEDALDDDMECLQLIATPRPLPKDGQRQQAHDNILTYIAGYIVSKIRLSLCMSCQGIVSGSAGSSDEQILLAQKQYSHVQDHGLEVPSPALVDAVKQMEAVYSERIVYMIYEDHVKSRLSAAFAREISTSLLVCPLASCAIQKMVVDKFLNCRFHFTLKDCSRHFSDKTRNLKPNKKVLKVSHL